MKRFNLVFLFILIHLAAAGQMLNNLIRIPVTPTDTDTVMVIIDLTYTGNCNYGMVYYNSFLSGQDIYLMPTYCGFGDTTLCNEIDTMYMGPFPPGNYLLNLEIHQGSICPISGFDATLNQWVSSMTVTSTTATNEISTGSVVTYYPNPADNILTIVLPQKSADFHLEIVNLFGQITKEYLISEEKTNIEISFLQKGIYLFRLSNQKEMYRNKIIVE